MSCNLLTTGWLRALPLGLLSLALGTAAAKEPELEIKLFVAEAEIDEATKRIEQDFGPEKATKHEIYFFDTDAQDLYESTAGPVILRARRKGTDMPQSTVKFRRDKRDPDLERKLRAISKKFEIQIEAIVRKKGPPGISYALDAKWNEDALTNLEAASGQTIGGLFSGEQKEFLAAAGVTVDWDDLKVYGRIDAEAWDWKETKDKRVDAKITAELWRLGEQRIYELSCKKPDKDATRQVDNFEAFFKDHKILAAENPPSKTKQALDFFSKRSAAQPNPAATGPWHKVADGKLMGIGGMALLKGEGETLSFLVVHDNKNAGEPRAGILRYVRGGEPKYQQIEWPDAALPVDLEALTAIPGIRGEFLASTSKGKLYRVKVSASQEGIEAVQKLDQGIPGTNGESEIEGLALATLGDHTVAAWADRGDDEKAATFSWASFDATSNTLNAAEATKIKVPWPEKNARDVSDIRIDSAGAVFITSAYESDDDASNATFASAVYLAGVFKGEDRQIRFSQNTELTRLYHFEGRKIEALEMVPGARGGIVLATDDEHQGSSVYLDW